MKRTGVAALAFLALALSGCVGGNHILHFDTVKVPVSLSSSLLDANGDLVPQSRQMFKGRFEGEYRGWSTLWTLVDLNTIDLSDDINARVKELDGDAVVRLRCQVCSNGSVSNMVLWINMLPFWVGAVKVKVDADVVQVTPPTQPTPEEEASGH